MAVRRSSEEDEENSRAPDDFSHLVHNKDEFGHDLWFGVAEDLRLPPFPFIKDFTDILPRISDVKLQPNDVIIAGFPKSGLNWVHQLVRMLIDGTEVLPPEYTDVDYLLEGLGNWYKERPASKRRILVSHLPFKYFPIDVSTKEVRIIYVTRNPKDVYASLFCYVTKKPAPIGYKGSWEQFFPLVQGTDYWYGNYFDHLRAWEEDMYNHPQLPIFHISLESLIKDRAKQLSGLDFFLGTERSISLCQAIAEECKPDSVHVMPSERNQLLSKCLWDNNFPYTSLCIYGEIGNWVNWFTHDQNERFDNLFMEKMAGSQITFQFQ